MGRRKKIPEAEEYNRHVSHNFPEEKPRSHAQITGTRQIHVCRICYVWASSDVLSEPGCRVASQHPERDEETSKTVWNTDPITRLERFSDKVGRLAFSSRTELRNHLLSKHDISGSDYRKGAGFTEFLEESGVRNYGGTTRSLAHRYFCQRKGPGIGSYWATEQRSHRFVDIYIRMHPETPPKGEWYDFDDDETRDRSDDTRALLGLMRDDETGGEAGSGSESDSFIVSDEEESESASRSCSPVFDDPSSPERERAYSTSDEEPVYLSDGEFQEAPSEAIVYADNVDETEEEQMKRQSKEMAGLDRRSRKRRAAPIPVTAQERLEYIKRKRQEGTAKVLLRALTGTDDEKNE